MWPIFKKIADKICFWKIGNWNKEFFFLGTFCPLGRFVLGTFCPWDVLSLGPYVWGRFVLGRLVPWDVLSWDVLSVHHTIWLLRHFLSKFLKLSRLLSSVYLHLRQKVIDWLVSLTIAIGMTSSRLNCVSLSARNGEWCQPYSPSIHIHWEERTYTNIYKHNF